VATGYRVIVTTGKKVQDFMKWYWWLAVVVVCALAGYYLWKQYSEGKKMEGVRKAKADKRHVEETDNTASV
jgi:amino acid permease